MKILFLLLFLITACQKDPIDPICGADIALVNWKLEYGPENCKRYKQGILICKEKR